MHPGRRCSQTLIPRTHAHPEHKHSWQWGRNVHQPLQNTWPRTVQPFPLLLCLDQNHFNTLLSLSLPPILICLLDPPYGSLCKSAQFHPCLLTKEKRLESLKVMHWERFLVSAGKWQSDCLWCEAGVLSLALWRLLLNSQTPSLYKEKKASELNSFAQALTQWSHPRNVGKIKVGCVVLNFRLTLRWDPSVFTSAARITVNRSVRARDLKTSARIPLRLFYSSVNSSFKAHWLIWPQISSNRVEQKDPVREIYNCYICFQINKLAFLRRAQNFSINTFMLTYV